jgi:hypothetical protein
MLAYNYDECAFRCRSAECRYTECRNLVHYAECRYVECHFAECHSINQKPSLGSSNPALAPCTYTKLPLSSY